MIAPKKQFNIIDKGHTVRISDRRKTGVHALVIYRCQRYEVDLYHGKEVDKYGRFLSKTVAVAEAAAMVLSHRPAPAKTAKVKAHR